jgi:hypothetical protein
MTLFWLFIWLLVPNESRKMTMWWYSIRQILCYLMYQENGVWSWAQFVAVKKCIIKMQNYKWEHTNMSIDHLTIITFQQNKIRVHQCFIILYCTTKYKFMISNRLSIIGGDVRKCRKNIISKADFIKRKCFVCTSPLLYSTLLKWNSLVNAKHNLRSLYIKIWWINI